MFARYFVDRPVLATVISVVIIILGLVAVVRAARSTALSGDTMFECDAP